VYSNCSKNGTVCSIGLKHSGHQYRTTSHVSDLKLYHLPINENGEQGDALEDSIEECEQDGEEEYQITLLYFFCY